MGFTPWFSCRVSAPNAVPDEWAVLTSIWDYPKGFKFPCLRCPKFDHPRFPKHIWSIAPKLLLLCLLRKDRVFTFAVWASPCTPVQKQIDWCVDSSVLPLNQGKHGNMMMVNERLRLEILRHTRMILVNWHGEWGQKSKRYHQLWRTRWLYAQLRTSWSWFCTIYLYSKHHSSDGHILNGFDTFEAFWSRMDTFFREW